MRRVFINTLFLFLSGIVLSSVAIASCNQPSEGAENEKMYGFAACLIQKQQYDGAVHYLEGQIQGGVEEAEAYRLLGESYIYLSRMQDALNAFESAYALDSKNTWIKSSLAIALFERGLQISPTQVQGKINSLPAECQPTQAVVDQVDAGLSRQYIERAYELTGEVAEAFVDHPILWADKQSARGMMLVELGRFDEAIIVQSQAADFMLAHADSSNIPEFVRKGAASIYANIANQLLLDRQIELAQDYARLALVTAPDDGTRADLRAMVQDTLSFDANKSPEAPLTNLDCGRLPILTSTVELEDL